MKHVLAMLISIQFLGCGVAEHVNYHCDNSDLESLCTTVFGGLDREQTERIDGIDQRLAELELTVDDNISDINNLTIRLNSLQTDVEGNASEISAMQDLINNLQTTTNLTQVQITQIQNSDTITEIIDVCGDGSGYDEVILRATNGKLMAYFESGSKRFLSLLPVGTYQTTDNTSCTFKVIANGDVCWGGGFSVCQ